MVMSERATFELATRLRTADGAPLGEVFAFLSGLYFRGKLAYARAFARPPDPASPISGAGSFVITPNAGLRSVDTPVTLAALRALRRRRHRRRQPEVPPAARSRAPAPSPRTSGRTARSCSSAASRRPSTSTSCRASSAQRLLFPADFVGRGDMSRGGLMLRSVTAAEELRVHSCRRRRPPRRPAAEADSAQVCDHGWSRSHAAHELTVRRAPDRRSASPRASCAPSLGDSGEL